MVSRKSILIYAFFFLYLFTLVYGTEKDAKEGETADLDEEKLEYARGSVCRYCEYCKVIFILRTLKRIVAVVRDEPFFNFNSIFSEGFLMKEENIVKQNLRSLFIYKND